MGGLKSDRSTSMLMLVWGSELFLIIWHCKVQRSITSYREEDTICRCWRLGMSGRRTITSIIRWQRWMKWHGSGGWSNKLLITFFQAREQETIYFIDAWTMKQLAEFGVQTTTKTSRNYCAFWYYQRKLPLFSFAPFGLLERMLFKKPRPLWQSDCNVVERGRKNSSIDIHLKIDHVLADNMFYLSKAGQMELLPGICFIQSFFTKNIMDLCNLRLNKYWKRNIVNFD